MKTLPIALVLCCGVSGIGLAGCQTVEDDGYYDRSYSTVEYRTGGYVRDYDYGSGYREPVRRPPPPRYVVDRPPPPIWNGGGRNPPPTWGGGGRNPPPAWGGGGRNPPPQVGGGYRPPPQVGGGYRPPPQGQPQRPYLPEGTVTDIGR